MLEHRIDKLHDWFDLQFLLVEVLTDKCEVPFNRAVTYYTNLHRRFGFGRPSEELPSTEWMEYVAELSHLDTRSKRIKLTKEFGRYKIISDRPIDRLEFGCFNFDGPNEEGTVRIHFASNDRAGGCGPLSHTKIEKRYSEMTEMFSYMRNTYCETAKYVSGVSWLYNLESYRRLFPIEYSDSRVIYKSRSMTLAGMPFWGQFLDHEENIRTDIRDQFLLNLNNIDLCALWKLFPMPVMLTQAPINVFYNYYLE